MSAPALCFLDALKIRQRFGGWRTIFVFLADFAPTFVMFVFGGWLENGFDFNTLDAFLWMGCANGTSVAPKPR
ncbi:MAG: hypothetical protein H0U74_05260 [Bradymonadaceae bacterium]|nr:hypothetical protein [Lujinxingiaceae bacterium]